MIGIVVVTHSNLGEALIEAAEFIIGDRPDGITSVSIDIAQDVDKLRGKVAAAIKEVDQKDGVLILTDMFGGTPSNLSYSFLEEGHIEVLSGVNLPVLIEATQSRQRLGLSDLATRIEAQGKKSITLASGVLKGNKRST